MEPKVGFARDAARNLLRKHRIVTAPVPIYDIAAGEGYRVEEISLNDKVSGFLKPKDKCIYINSRHHAHRKRFTLAHELGHAILFHEKLKAADFADLDKCAADANGTEARSPEDSPFERTSKDPYDVEADEFAGELLVPRAFLKKDWAQLGSIEGVSERYNVSTAVASIAYMRVIGVR